MSKPHTYRKDGLTIVWEPDKCIHSTRCWRQLGTVFQPGKRPWIVPEGATAERIKAQIDRCPSGALSYRAKAPVKPPRPKGPPPPPCMCWRPAH